MEHPDTARSRRFHLVDLAAIVPGYALAALMVRGFWPVGSSLSSFEVALVIFLMLWLGLAMSGPAVLLGRRLSVWNRQRDAGSPAMSSVEMAWMLIGTYWLLIAALVVAAREASRYQPVLEGVVGFVWILVVQGMYLELLGGRGGVGARRIPPGTDSTGWTHTTAVVLLVTWPVAWIFMIFLGKYIQ